MISRDLDDHSIAATSFEAPRLVLVAPQTDGLANPDLVVVVGETSSWRPGIDAIFTEHLNRLRARFAS